MILYSASRPRIWFISAVTPHQQRPHPTRRQHVLLRLAPLARLGAIKNSSNQPHLTPPAPTTAFRERLDHDARCQKVQQFGGA
jgi:hypothetical protein